jgi:hypothetical protein
VTRAKHGLVGVEEAFAEVLGVYRFFDMDESNCSCFGFYQFKIGVVFYPTLYYYEVSV